MFFKNSLALIACIAVFSLTSCKSDTESSTSSATEVPATTTTTEPQSDQLPPDNSAGVNADPNSQPVQVTTPSGNTQPVQIQTTQPVQMQNSQPAGGMAKKYPNSGQINPPHGQPGHTCDVKVGEVIP